MGFASPWMLLALPLAGLVPWSWQRQRKPAWRYSHLQLVAGLPRGRAAWAEHLAVLLRGLIVAAGVLALAGPRVPDLKTRVPTEGIALAFVCDISGSMAERDFAWETGNPPDSRLRAVQRAFRLFVEGGPAPDGVSLEGRPADAIALVSLAAWPRTECPLTLNHSVLLGMVDHLEAKTGGLDAGTNIGDAIAEGLIRLQAATELRRVVILLSDGEHNASREGPHAPLTPRQAAQLAANLGIPIYTIDCGGEPQADAPAELQQQRRDGRRVLDNIASMTQGRSFVANSGSELRQVYAAIDQLERRPIESAVYRRYHEYRGWCVAGAVASWLLLMVLEELLWRRWPQ